jgi:hypothetical protein
LGAPGEKAFAEVTAQNEQLAELSNELGEPTEARPVPPRPEAFPLSDTERRLADGTLRVFPSPEALSDDRRRDLNWIARNEEGPIVHVVEERGAYTAYASTRGLVVQWWPEPNRGLERSDSVVVNLPPDRQQEVLDQLAAEGMPYETREVRVPAIEGLKEGDLRPAWQLVP